MIMALDKRKAKYIMDIMVKDLRYTFQVTSISKAIKRNIQICF
jgi:hypothetical protein